MELLKKGDHFSRNGNKTISNQYDISCLGPK